MNIAYESSDFGLAVTLCCLGFRVVSMNRSNPKRVLFCFGGDRTAIDEAVRKYWDLSLKLSPLEVFTHQKLLKQRLYSEQP